MTGLSYTELGSGMPVIFCHGFPGLGYSWRHQLEPVAGAGFRAVAVDMLGYGASPAPHDPREYTHEKITAGLLALLDDLGADEAVFVGQDFGAPAAWQTALRAPERVHGLALLSVPYDPGRLPTRPSEVYRAVAERHFFHVDYFQERGRAEAELDAAPREFLHRLFHALSGAFHYLDIWHHSSAGNGYLDVLPPAPPLPWSWLSTQEFEHYVEVFARTGFAGGLTWYRAFDLNWEQGEALAGAHITVPTTFIAGTDEPVLAMVGDRGLDTMRAHVDDLRGVHLIEGAGHWVQQEQPDQVNLHLLQFLRDLRSGS